MVFIMKEVLIQFSLSMNEYQIRLKLMIYILNEGFTFILNIFSSLFLMCHALR